MPETADRHLEEIREIRLSDYFWILFRNKWSVLLIFLLSVFAAFLITDLTPPVFQSETTIRVLEGQSADLAIFAAADIRDYSVGHLCSALCCAATVTGHCDYTGSTPTQRRGTS